MKKYLIGLSVAFNFIVITSVTWFLLGGGEYLLNRLFAEPAMERSITQFEALGVSSDDTVFLGDSITYGGLWDEIFPETNTSNRGINGDTSGGVLARLDQIINGGPNQLFLMIGTNDLYYGATEAEIVANVVEIINRTRQTSPETEIYVQSVLPRAESYKERIESLNAALESAVRDKAEWVNLYPLFLDEPGISISDNLSNDELHLLGDGYLLWQEAISHLVSNT